MSSGPETRFIASVHRYLPPPDEFHREKMANPYRGGTADSWYSSKRDLWVEWKWVDLPAREDTVISIVDGKKPPLSVLQQDWITRRVDEGRNVWVIVGSLAGGLILPNGWDGGRWTKEEFVDRCTARQDIAYQIRNFCT